MPGALGHIRVLDLTSHVAGPYCTKLLADYGADVVKIERPGSGDVSRRLGPYPGGQPDPEASALFVYLNGNKKSVTLDLSTSDGQAVLAEMIKTSDLTVVSLRPAAIERLGLDAASLAAINPRLASLTITSFGMTGPYRDYRADHMILCGMAGWAQYLGEKKRPPVQAGMQTALQVTGVQAASAAIGVYQQSQASGRGHHVDVSIMETVTHLLPASVLRYHMSGVVETRGMYPFPSQGILRCQDGYLGVNTLTEEHWELMCRWMGLDDLLGDPRMQNSVGRWEHTAYLRERAEAYFADKTKAELFHEGQGWRVATGLVSTAQDILDSEHLRERGYFTPTGHPGMGSAVQPGPPIRLTASPWSLRSPAPALGEHNHEVLSGDLGLSAAEVSLLRERGAI